ncbi:MAG: hypothetical protein HY816_21115 [Candidatus Wallbacteria bacterium]|nr:hypothetical protein [Candidatus Wallbacteria bacterium]
MTRKLVIVIAAGLLYGAAPACLLAAPDDNAPSTRWREVTDPAEAELSAQSAAIINQSQRTNAQRNAGQTLRGFHAKPHSAMLAELRVCDDLPPRARHGIFATAKRYPCWVRFSNGLGVTQSDHSPDLRGLAIKVLGTEGPSLAPGEASAKTQDFLMATAPAFPVRNASQYVALLQGFKGLSKRVGRAEALRIGAFVARRTLRRIESLTTETYWTGVPLKLGPHAVKCFLQPQPMAGQFPREKGPDYLRGDLVARLRKSDVRFDFMVQFFVDETRTPIEDAAVEWQVSDSQPIKVAELIISSRDLESPKAKAQSLLGTSLAFTPWHASEDHRPLGSIMRMRRQAYGASSALRGHHAEPEPAQHQEGEPEFLELRTVDH